MEFCRLVGGALVYGHPMLVVSIVATVVAAASAAVAVLALRQAKRSADAAERSLAEAKRSADAAEKSAGSAAVTAQADRAEDHRQRAPRLLVSVDAKVAHDGDTAIYRVVNEGPADLDSVVVRRPVLGPVEGAIVHYVAGIDSDYDESAEIGPIPMGQYGRFTLSLGNGATLPQFRVTIVSTVGGESWSEVVLLDDPRMPPPPRQAQVAFPSSVRRSSRRPPERGRGGLSGF